MLERICTKQRDELYVNVTTYKKLYIHQLWKSLILLSIPSIFSSFPFLFSVRFQQRSRGNSSSIGERVPSLVFFSSDKISILMYNKQKEWHPCVLFTSVCLSVSEKMSLAGEKFLVSLYPPLSN